MAEEEEEVVVGVLAPQMNAPQHIFINSMFLEAGNLTPITAAAIEQVRKKTLPGRTSTVERAIELIRLYQCNDLLSEECLAYKFLHDPRAQQRLRMMMDNTTKVLVGRGVRANRPQNSVMVVESSLVSGTQFLVKYVDAQDEAPYAPLEVAIGLYGVNALKSIIPNFSCVYGYVGCTAPVFATQGRIDWCRNIPQTYGARGVYIIGEYVHGVNVQQFLRACVQQSFPDDYVGVVFTSIVSGLFAALLTAQHRCGFTHYDLKTDNVMVRELPTAEMVTYPDIVLEDGHPLRLMTRFVPVVIDYGLSRIDVNMNRYFGMPGGRDEPIGRDMLRSFIDYNVANVAIDAYKFVMDLWNTCDQLASHGKNVDYMRSLVDPLFAYFTNDPRLAAQTLSQSFTINTELLNGRNVSDLITILRTNDVYAPFIAKLFVKEWKADSDKLTINFPQHLEQLITYETIRRVFQADADPVLPEPDDADAIIQRDLQNSIAYLQQIVDQDGYDVMDVILSLTKLGKVLEILKEELPGVVDEELYLSLLHWYRKARDKYAEAQDELDGTVDADIVRKYYVIPDL